LRRANGKRDGESWKKMGTGKGRKKFSPVKCLKQKLGVREGSSCERGKRGNQESFRGEDQNQRQVGNFEKR